MEAELIKWYSWNASGIDEKNIAEMEEELMKRILLKWMLDRLKNIAEIDGDWWKNIAEMEAGLTKKYWWMRAAFSIKLILYIIVQRQIVWVELLTPNYPRRIARTPPVDILVQIETLDAELLTNECVICLNLAGIVLIYVC